MSRACDLPPIDYHRIGHNVEMGARLEGVAREARDAHPLSRRRIATAVEVEQREVEAGQRDSCVGKLVAKAANHVWQQAKRTMRGGSRRQKRCSAKPSDLV